jgi:glycine/D-amino acid oxidase-like deaminating enzyme
MSGVYEPRAGYLRVEACVAAHLEEATAAGAELRTQEAATSWQPEGSGVEVRTERGQYTADRLIITAGTWAGQLLTDLGIPLQVRRKPQYWFAVDDDSYRAERGCPGYIFEMPTDIFYGFPVVDEFGLKIARHTGGEIVADPLTVSRDFDPEDRRLVEDFVGRYMPGVTRRLLHHSICMYTMSPDEHFIIDRHPEHPQVSFAAGLSGHGFKFTSALGEALADLATQDSTRLPIGFLNCRRPGLV